MTQHHHEHHHKVAEKNALAKWWSHVVDYMKGPQGRTAWLLLAVGVLVVGLVGAFLYFSFVSTAAAGKLWTQLDLASSDAELAAFIKSHPDTTQAYMAELRVARRRMSSVDALATPNKANAIEKIGLARDGYAALAKKSGVPTALLQEALLGAGKASETLGELEAAKGYYQRLAAEKPETAAVKEARERVEWLNDKDRSAAIKLLAEYTKNP
jgi:tetratricopeptide (TPR) repeat protein